MSQLTPSIVTSVSSTGVMASGGSTAINVNPTRSPVSGVTGIAGVSATSVLPSGNLSATRIIQLQQQPGGASSQIIGSGGRLAANVMLQPIIVNTSGSGKFGM